MYESIGCERNWILNKGGDSAKAPIKLKSTNTKLISAPATHACQIICVCVRARVVVCVCTREIINESHIQRARHISRISLSECEQLAYNGAVDLLTRLCRIRVNRCRMLYIRKQHRITETQNCSKPNWLGLNQDKNISDEDRRRECEGWTTNQDG